MLQPIPDPRHPSIADDLVVTKGQDAEWDVEDAGQRDLEGKEPRAVPVGQKAGGAGRGVRRFYCRRFCAWNNGSGYYS